ncbi:Feruloyl esterase [Oceaniovalibus guishaninsula JLT2003]|uniref:Feruloyl esterase n=1 Tax=Oceaniovalibus guishaninsula JLT2003 TaxID=1231392 RepID=K2HP14_9RHOB|nr:tannase/feruloyl esterase family alpha/beta hydrolase [Oceaniovalibus guishaninsula]EKE44599.1 Feruloyl esterase [Oceaniovalibus guishaninsula JLT2003]
MAAKDDLPGYCRIAGTIRPAIGFEVRLPTSDWNGKFYMAGCGGFCGKVDADSPNLFNAINHALKRGYAVATMDGGHWGSGSTDARWADANPVAEADWGYRAVEETTRVAKALTTAFYGEDPRHAYFQGCSTGGRMANMAAMRMPDAFDGIISGAPALDYPGLVGTSFAWIAQANTDRDGNPILQPEDARIVADAVIAACDAADGVEDGIVSDPPACRFDPATLDLAPEKIAVLDAWYSEPVDSAGTLLYPAAVPVGSEAFWPLWLTGMPGGGGALVPRAFGPNFLRYMAFPDDPGADYSPQNFDFDTDPARMAPQEDIYNSDDPDLGAFAESGGKLLMYHGWADAIVFPGKTVAYFEDLQQTTGGDFARLFMVPGMDHCGIQTTGPGIAQDGIDPLTALERWVEDGAAPDSIETTKTAEGTPVWTRPACAWPAKAVFSGEGEWQDAANWSCKTE